VCRGAHPARWAGPSRRPYRVHVPQVYSFRARRTGNPYARHRPLPRPERGSGVRPVRDRVPSTRRPVPTDGADSASAWGSQIDTRSHQPSASGTGRYSVEQPPQSGICSLWGGGQPCRRRSAARECRSPKGFPPRGFPKGFPHPWGAAVVAHRCDLTAASPASEGRPRPAGGVEPGRRRQQYRSPFLQGTAFARQGGLCSVSQLPPSPADVDPPPARQVPLMPLNFPVPRTKEPGEGNPPAP
jgi:hypothetical protein